MPDDAPLTYGQLYSRREIEAYPAMWHREANLSTTVRLPDLPVSLVDAALEALFRRHEPLRTTYQERDGGPVQCVHTDVERPVRRIDVADAESLDPEAITADLARQPFPLVGALGWAGVLVTSGSSAVSLSLSFSHLIVDIWAIRRLAEEFRCLLMNPQSLEDVPVVSGLGLARSQREAAAGPRLRGAESYWRRLLDDDLAYRPPVPRDRQESPRIQAVLHSDELTVRAERAAAARGVTVPALFMAVITAAYAHCVDARRVQLSLMASNRFAPEHREVVGTMNQLIPVAATVNPDAPLGEHVTRLHWSAAKAYRHAGYDTDRVLRLSGGSDFNAVFPTWFNYLQLDGEPAVARLRRAEVTWNPEPRQCGQALDVRITAAGDRTSVAVRVDPQMVPADALVGLLRSVTRGVDLAGCDPQMRVADMWAGRRISRGLFPVA